jgi:hypothetical protein
MRPLRETIAPFVFPLFALREIILLSATNLFRQIPDKFLLLWSETKYDSQRGYFV